MWKFIEHHFNELNLYAWLRRKGISKPFARKVGKLTAQLTYKPAIVIKNKTYYIIGR
jgi:hypothetical protein